MSHLAEQPDDERNQPDFTPARKKPAAESVLALNGRSVASRGGSRRFSTGQGKRRHPNAPSFLYSEDRPGAIFGFYHIEALTARSNPEERQAGLHRHPDFDQLLILATGTCLFEHDGQKREVEAPVLRLYPGERRASVFLPGRTRPAWSSAFHPIRCRAFFGGTVGDHDDAPPRQPARHQIQD